mmetsp:Transcript_31830/g.46839  ORF Transcript_31830/g.46839 Transcript_31830/m.46839 type:complete len:108 (-) Transcript_31830:457-780(-)
MFRLMNAPTLTVEISFKICMLNVKNGFGLQNQKFPKIYVDKADQSGSHQHSLILDLASLTRSLSSLDSPQTGSPWISRRLRHSITSGLVISFLIDPRNSMERLVMAP